ncbi:hypothetical protein ACFPM3_05850 [Streptomyces coeruleoprunus]|uniref:Uncharacterized protein n=1 Tax=Streptomyces coeruleoprunus TaxID=285563 RepID=A0ABV9XCL7_9ACTN
MTVGRKGARRITVDGVPYRWRLRRRPTYGQALCWSPCTYAVEHAEQSGAPLVVVTDRPHLSNWLGHRARPVLPAEVADTIRTALDQGWTPTKPGSPFLLDLSYGFTAMP